MSGSVGHPYGCEECNAESNLAELNVDLERAKVNNDEVEVRELSQIKTQLEHTISTR